LKPETDSRPIVASYCATFLKLEMLHIYRQIAGLERVCPIVIAQKRENAQRYPFERVYIVPKAPTHEFRRFWFRKMRDMPWQISQMELNALLRILDRTGAQLLHIYFGHIAMQKPAYREATRRMLDAVSLVLVRSESLLRGVVDLGCEESKIVVQHTGIPLDEFPFRERSFPKAGEWRLVQACRLIEKKGLPTTLRTFANFLREYPNATLTIAGEGPLLDQLQSLARDLKIDNRVSFAGFVSQEQLREIYYRSHVFLQPSQTGADGNQEGIPNSMLEAMASGLPVFATRHGGIPEAIQHEQNGVLVAERDVDPLTRALLDAAQDRHRLAQLARNGAESVREKFDLGAQVRRLENVYLSLRGMTVSHPACT
jgi:glycosyltransferase involved in cell wall biosynthesis